MGRRNPGIRKSDKGPGRALVVNHGSELYGSDRMLVEGVRGLRDAGWSVEASLPNEGPLAGILRGLGAQVHFVPVPSVGRNLLTVRGLVSFMVQSIQAFPRQLSLIRRSSAELVYINTLTLPSWALAGRLTRRRVVCHVHEAERSSNRLLQVLLAGPLALCHRLIVNSETTLDTISRPFGFLRRRARVAPNGVAGPVSAADPPENLGGSVRVLYVGRLSRRKGPHIAIEAVRQLRESGIGASLSLLGAVFEGYEWYADELRQQIAQCGLEDHVDFLGFRPDVWSTVNEHDVVVVPSTADESFGNTAVEAVLAKRPVVCSDIPGLRESVGAYESALFVPPGEAAALAEALLEIFSHWDIYRTRALSAAEAARNRHDPIRYQALLATAATA